MEVMYNCFFFFSFLGEGSVDLEIFLFFSLFVAIRRYRGTLDYLVLRLILQCLVSFIIDRCDISPDGSSTREKFII